MEISESRINEWLDEIQIPHTSLPESQRPPQTNFVMQTGQKPKVLIYQHSKVPNRIIFQVEIVLAEEHKKLLTDKSKNEFNKIIVGWTHSLTTYDVNWKFDATGQAVKKLSINKFIDKSELSPDRFFQTLSRIEIVGNQMIRNIGISLNFPTQSVSPPSSDSESIYG